MAMGAFNLYDAGLEAIFDGGAGNLESVAIAAALLDSTHVVDLDLHDTWSDVSADELADADYGSVALTTKAVAQITGGINFDTDNVSFGNPVTIQDAKYIVFVIGTAGALAPTDKLLGIADLRSEGGTIGSIASEFTVQAPASGWFTVTRS